MFPSCNVCTKPTVFYVFMICRISHRMLNFPIQHTARCSRCVLVRSQSHSDWTRGLVLISVCTRKVLLPIEMSLKTISVFISILEHYCPAIGTSQVCACHNRRSFHFAPSFLHASVMILSKAISMGKKHTDS